MTEVLAELRGDDRFWVADPIDITRLVRQLRVFGFTDRNLAEEEARETTEDHTYYEVRVTRHHLHKQR